MENKYLVWEPIFAISLFTKVPEMYTVESYVFKAVHTNALKISKEVSQRQKQRDNHKIKGIITSEQFDTLHMFTQSGVSINILAKEFNKVIF